MKITPAPDRATYNVPSRSRRGLTHTVDVEELTCSCEGFMEFGVTDERKPCPHLERALAFHNRRAVTKPKRSESPFAFLSCRTA